MTFNPATDLKLPDGYVMPDTSPTFDYVTLIRHVMATAIVNNKFNPDVPYDQMYSLPVLVDGKISHDALLRFSSDYMEPYMKISRYLESLDEHRIGYTPRTDTASSKQPTTPVVRASQLFLARLEALLKVNLYKKTESVFSGLLTFVEYAPKRVLKNRTEFYPTVSIMLTPSKTFVFDLFVGGERLKSFNYGMPTNNQIVAPTSLMQRGIGATLTASELNQYKLGLDSAFRTIQKRIMASRQTKTNTRDPKIGK